MMGELITDSGLLADRQQPLSITVVIPAFNAGDCIASTLQSVLDQRIDNVDVILVDGGSLDDTVSVALSFSALNITVLSEPDRGQLDALQKGLRLAKGDILFWLNADDIVMPGAFREVLEAFSDSSVDFVYSNDVAFNEENAGFYYGPSIRGLTDWDHFLFYRQMYSECVYWRRSKNRFLDDHFYALRVYTDYAFFLRLRWGRMGKWIKKRLGAFRIREGQASAQFRNKKREEYKLVKDLHRSHIGMSYAKFNLYRIAYSPYFAFRHILTPQFERGVRRLARFVTKDMRRRSEALAFYEGWLLPHGAKGPRHGRD